MSQNIEQGEPLPNRRQRRYQDKINPNFVAKSAIHLDAVHRVFHQAEQSWDSSPKFPARLALEDSGASLLLRMMAKVSKMLGRDQINLFAPMIYRSNSKVFDLALASKNFDTAMKRYSEEEIPAWFTPDNTARMLDLYDARLQENLYADRFGSRVSLADIEQMDLPLRPDDIRSINTLVASNPFRTITYNHGLARNIALFLPLQVLARKEIIPYQIQPLAERLISYMDYYLPLIMQAGIDDSNLNNLLRTLAYLGQPFVQALGVYIPARTGLTPASLVKFYKERRDNDSIAGEWGTLNTVLIPETSESYTASGLPPHLFQYQLYNRDYDKNASFQLGEHYKASLDKGREFDSEVDTLLSRLHLYRRKLFPEALKGLPIDLEGHPVISRIILACQNKQNMMLVLLLKDGQTHLTLEVTEKGDVYGIPNQFKKSYLGTEDALLKDVLAPVVNLAQRMFPQIESSDHLAFRPLKKMDYISDPIVDSIPTKTKRRHFLPRLTSIVPELPIPKRLEEVVRAYQLVYEKNGEFKTISTDEDRLAYASTVAYKIYKKETRLKEDIEVLLKALVADPKGKGTYKIVDASVSIASRREDLWSFRGDERGIRFQHPESRKLRLVYCFDPMDSSVVIIEDILHHENFDKKFSS